MGGADSRGKPDQPFSLEGEQELPASHLAQSPVGLNPVPPPAKNPGDMGPSPLPVPIDRGLDLAKERRCDRLFSDG